MTASLVSGFTSKHLEGAASPKRALFERCFVNDRCSERRAMSVLDLRRWFDGLQCSSQPPAKRPDGFCT
jgi:hypothetical protein